jgi:hypothetical protein
MIQRLKPIRPDLVIYDPDARPPRRVPADGLDLDTSRTFWRRRIKDGEMVVVEPAKPFTRVTPTE